jgi:hypothetical protein
MPSLVPVGVPGGVNVVLTLTVPEFMIEPPTIAGPPPLEPNIQMPTADPVVERALI